MSQWALKATGKEVNIKYGNIIERNWEHHNLNIQKIAEKWGTLKQTVTSKVPHFFDAPISMFPCLMLPAPVKPTMYNVNVEHEF
jgi:hypothetical protein